ncbi:ABC transporter substrate-binding protein [Dechloromonas sp. CZR5]|uniref:ABC transporter substrate-binding protein n=1 Tax=Dechloromonas sp. CZR5 TaxID=2608630 RepID=UPI00123C98C4|nr:ABC transporter substrate-binding protein [Dechloromonas sp. CZR5]
MMSGVLRFFRCWLAIVCVGWAGTVLGLERVSVQLPWKHQFEFAAFYAAEAKGYYRDAGLAVDILEGDPGVDTVSTVLSGKADFGIGTSSLVIDRHQGKPVVALAALMQHSPVGLLARRAHGINSVSDLADRPVAVDVHSSNEIEAYLKASGLPANRLKLVPQTDWTLASVDRGEHAAKAVYLSNEPFLISGREHEYLLLTPRSAGIDLFGNILFTTESMLGKRPELVRAFREATLKGLVYALDHSDEIAQLVIERYNTQGKSLEHLRFEAEQIRELTRPDIVEAGYMNPGRWRHVVAVYASQKLMPGDFDVEPFLYAPDRRQALPAWLLWSMAITLALLVCALLVAVRMRRINFALQREAGERQRAERKYRELVENANVIILRLSPSGVVTYFNEVAERVFGFRADEVIGRPIIETIVPASESVTERDLARVISAILDDPEAYAENENENVTRDGRRIWVRWFNRAILSRDERFEGVLCIGHDITEQHGLEIELAQYRDHLEEQVNERTRELSLAREAAERLSEVKSRFLTNMSHEMRTPLHQINGLLQIFKRQEMTAKQTQLLERLQAATQGLTRTIDAILEMSWIDSGRLALKRQVFALQVLIDEIAGMAAEQASVKGLEFVCDTHLTDTQVVGDPVLIRRAIANYIDNAMRFTPNGRITLRANAELFPGGELELRLEVEDTGVGIAAEDIDRLFSIFEQGDNSQSRLYSGLGVGLAMTRQIALAMGGKVGCRSVLGEGSVFWLTFRLARVGGQ